MRIGFGFASHWLKNWREIYRLISKSSNGNRVILFHSHLKTALSALRMHFCVDISLQEYYDLKKHQHRVDYDYHSSATRKAGARSHIVDFSSKSQTIYDRETGDENLSWYFNTFSLAQVQKTKTSCLDLSPIVALSGRINNSLIIYIN